jgi:uncharacterized protein YdeI (YjbR/CyaY-like superfamily)
MDITENLYVKNRDEWRIWLEKYHAVKKEIWLIYYKKHTGKPRIPYDAAVEEALCFGWIDSTVKSVDDEIYVQKFTPRNKKSQWSETNLKRLRKMLDAGKMTKAGLDKAEEVLTKDNNIKENTIKLEEFTMPPEFEEELKNNQKAFEFFLNLAPSYKKMYIQWVARAKRKETMEKRIETSISRLEQGKKLGLV